MNLDALVKADNLPWSPNPAVTDLDVWHQYEHPMVGTFRSHDEPVFFTTIGEYGDNSVWAYVCLTEQEAKDFAQAEFESPEAMREFAEELLRGRKTLFALADDLLIRNWSVLGEDEQGSLDDLALVFLNRVLEGLKSHTNSATMLRAKLAQVDVASAELIDA